MTLVGGRLHTRVILVRHGNTFGPSDTVTRVGGRTDLPLVASGLEQADALGRWFSAQGFAFQHIYCSPLRRTRETAERILAGLGSALAPQVEPALTEIDHGPDENRPEAEVLARIGASALEAWERDAVPPPGWVVDPAALAAAWRQFLDRLAVQGGDALVVTSNGVARFALAGFGQPLLAKLRTGAFGVITLADGAARLEAWDQRPGA